MALSDKKKAVVVHLAIGLAMAGAILILSIVLTKVILACLDHDAALLAATPVVAGVIAACVISIIRGNIYKFNGLLDGLDTFGGGAIGTGLATYSSFLTAFGRAQGICLVVLFSMVIGFICANNAGCLHRRP